mgnify:CR=1 FL=1
MTSIPLALIGVDHPHATDWYGTLARVSELTPVAHYDPQPEKAKKLIAPPYDTLPVYGDVGELLARHRVQAALVMLPLKHGVEVMLPLAKAGVHMMAEKPVARSADDLQPVASALQPGTVFYSGYAWRFDAIVRQVKTLIDEDILGRLWSIEMRWITSKVGRRPGIPAHRDPDSYLFRREISRGGMLQWLGCHWLDLMCHLAGEPVAAVAAMTARQTSDEIEVEDMAVCLLRYKSGMLGTLHVGYLLPAGGDTFLGIRGSLGWMRWDCEAGRRFTVHSEHPSWAASPTRVFDFPRGPDPSYGAGTGAALLRDFARCINDGGQNPTLTIADALRVLHILDAAYAAAASGHETPVA